MTDDYLNAEPLIPLPKVRVNGALVPEQLIMLWWMWAGGMALGMLVFFIERFPRGKAKANKNGRHKVVQYAWTTGRHVHVHERKPELQQSLPEVAGDRRFSPGMESKLRVKIYDKR